MSLPSRLNGHFVPNLPQPLTGVIGSGGVRLPTLPAPATSNMSAIAATNFMNAQTRLSSLLRRGKYGG